MKHLYPLIDFFLYLFSLGIFLYTYSFMEGCFIHWQSNGTDQMWSMLLRVLSMEGFGMTVALGISLIIIRRKFRIIVGVWHLLIFLVLYLPLYVLPYLVNWFDAAVGIVRISFVACGAAAALAFWQWIDASVKLPKTQAKEFLPAKKNIPKTSLVLLGLSLVSIPVTYVMIALSAMITLGIFLWVLGLISLLPFISVQLLMAMAIPLLLSVWVAVRALQAVFFSSPHFECAVKIDLASTPHLRKMIEEVCLKLRTEFPQQILLHAEPNFFVLQRSLKVFDGMAEGRILGLGLPAVQQLNANEFKSILAHEFAHFTGKDTLYNCWVVPLSESLVMAIKDLGGIKEGMEDHDDVWLNAFSGMLFFPNIFLNLLLAYFSTINGLLSRSRELRADWIAAQSYGGENFAGALQKVVSLSRHYAKYMEKFEPNDKNFFEQYQSQLSKDHLTEYLNQAMQEVELDHDSHPSLKTRLDYLNAQVNENLPANGMEKILIELKPAEQTLSVFYQQRMTDLRKLWEKIKNAV